MDLSNLPLPPADSDFIDASQASRAHRTHVGGGWTLAEMRYNCRVTQARNLAEKQSTPARDAAEMILQFLK